MKEHSAMERRKTIMVFALVMIFMTIIHMEIIRAEIKLCYEPTWQAGQYTYYTGLGWADVDDNGWIDFISATGIDVVKSPLVVHYNSDSGLEASPSWVSSEIGTYCQLYLGDLNNDGDQDVIISSLGLLPAVTHGPQYMFCDTGKTFTSTACWKPAVNTNSFSCVTGDPDGDGDLDIAYANGDFVSGYIQYTWMFYNNGGSFNTTPDWQTDETYYGVDAAFCDIDLDGDLDFILGGRQLSIAVFKNNNGVIETSPSWDSYTIGVGRQIAFGDVDNDGYPDLAVASIDGFHLFKNNAGTLETNPSWSCSYYTEPSAVAWADVDNDGYLELAGGGKNTHLGVFDNVGGTLSSEYIWKYNGDGSFGTYCVDQVNWADYDQDGLVDSTAIFVGDGTKKLYHIKGPLHSISSLKIGGTTLGLSQYCYDLMEGWISLAMAPASGDTLTIDYTYSNDLDLVVGTDKNALIFENIDEYNRPLANMNVLMLIGQDYGSAYNQPNGPLNIMDYVRRYGWNVTTTAITNNVNPCNYHQTYSNGSPISVDKLVSEISDISNYDALIIMPCNSGYSAEMTDPSVLNLITSAVDSGLIVAAWCRGARLLAAADVIDGKKVTGNANYVTEYANAGATYMGTVPPVTDGNIVTIIRSLFYRTEGCEAIYNAIYKNHYALYDIDSSDFRDDDEDGVYLSGEHGQFHIFLTNHGLVDSNIAITMTSTDPDIVFINPTSQVLTISHDSSANNILVPIEFIVPNITTSRFDSFYVTIQSDKMAGEIIMGFDLVIGQPEILIVDDDRGGSYESIYYEILHKRELTSKVWEKALFGPPTEAEIDKYHIVLWYTGDSTNDYLSESDIAVMKEYLNDGGYLLLSGQGLASEIFAQDSLFLKDYLHCRYGGKISYSLYHNGVIGTPLGDNVSVKIIGGAGQVAGLSERVIPVNGGVTNFTNGGTPIAGSAISYSGSYRTIFLSWGFEAIEDGLSGYINKDSLMTRIMAFSPDFICGDANDDGKINLLDVSYIISSLYRGGPKPDPIQSADVNSDGKMNLLDVSYIISYLYRHGPAPDCP